MKKPEIRPDIRAKLDEIYARVAAKLKAEEESMSEVMEIPPGFGHWGNAESLAKGAKKGGIAGGRKWKEIVEARKAVQARRESYRSGEFGDDDLAT